MPGPVVILLVDTEGDHWLPVPRDTSVENIHNLPRFQERCDRLGVPVTYLATYGVVSTPWAADILRELQASGHSEIGGHLHPWDTPPMQPVFDSRHTMTKNLPEAVQRAKVAILTQRIEEEVGTKPVSFRAGRYGLGRETVKILIDLGYRFDCSVTPWMSWSDTDDGPDFTGAPLSPYRLDGTTDPREPAIGGGLLEIPISSGYSRWPFDKAHAAHHALRDGWLRPFRTAGLAARLGILTRLSLNPEFNSSRGMIRLARILVAHGVPHLSVSLHSPSLQAGLTPYSQSSADVERLYRTLDQFCAALHKFTTPTFVTMSNAGGLLG